jgi:copper(I)-binding protein
MIYPMKLWHYPSLVLLALLTACAPSQQVIQTAIALTQSVLTPLPTQTAYPTYTPQPAIVITKIVTETYTPTPEFSPTPTLPSPKISADGGWGHITRTPTIAAFYMLIHNTGEAADELTGAASPSCGYFTMQQMGYPDTSHLPVYMGIPAKSVVALQMGEFQYRLLCYDISGIGVGSSVPLTLSFEKSGAVQLMIDIQETPN